MNEHTTSGGDQRRHERHVANENVYLEVDGHNHAGHLTDVSAGGAFLDHRLQVKPGQDVMLLVPRFDLTAKATVRRSTKCGVGLSFDDETVGRIIGGWMAA